MNFYQAKDYFQRPPRTLYFAVKNDKIYNPISQFNQLLIDQDIEVNDGNIVTLAKAFVIIASSEFRPFPEITFLEGKRINKRIKGEGPYHVMIKIKINDKIEEWYFDFNPLVAKGQLQAVSILELSTGRFYHKYFPIIVPKEKSKEGGMDSPPRIQIDTSFGGIYLGNNFGDTIHNY
jgi:hypothetical protein